MKKSVLFLIIISACASLQISAQTVSQRYTEAMDAYRAGEYARAEKIFHRFFTEYKPSDELYAMAKYYSGDSFMKLGEYDAAASDFEYLVNNFNWSAFRVNALYNLGIIYFKQEKFPLSRERFKTLIKDYPESEFAGSSYYWVGETYSKEKNYEDAIAFLKDAIANHQNNKYIDRSIFTLANLYEEIGDYTSAVKYYDQLLSYHSNSPLAVPAHIRIGICYFKLKKYDSSVLELNNPALEQIPANLYVQSLYLLANSYYRLQNYSGAEKVYMEIISKYPSFAQIKSVKYGLAWTYFQQKKYNEAYRVFNALSTGGTDSIAVKSFFWKAESKRYAGQDEEAYKLYNQFLDRFPGSDMLPNVQYQLAVLYYDQQRYPLAEKFLASSAAVSDSSLKAKALILLGNVRLDQKKYDSAAKSFESVIKTHGISGEALNRAMLGLAVCQYYNKKYSDAVVNLSDIAFREPGFEKGKVNFYMAECFYSEGKYKDAVDAYTKAEGAGGEISAMAVYGKAYSYLNMRDYEDAARLFSEFVKKYPGNSRNIDARLRLADSYYGSKNFAAASRIYKEMFRVDRSSLNNPEAYYQFAQALYKAGSYTEAIQEFKTLQQKFPGSAYGDKALYIIGWISFQQSKYEDAISEYRDVLKVYPNSELGPTLYYSIGDAYFNQGKYDSAIVNYQKVMIDYPSSKHVFDAVNGIQYSYLAQGKPKQAVNLISNFVSQNPGLSFADQIFIKKGDIYYSMQDYKNAETAYKEFVANYPNSSLISQAYYWIGKSAENQGKGEEAIFNFEKVFQNYPASQSAPDAVIEMGNIYNKDKQYGKAVELYDQALQSLPNTLRFPEILFSKGMTLVDMGQDSSGAEVFNNIANSYGGTVFAAKSKLELGIMQMVAKQYPAAESYFGDLAANRTDDIGAKAQYYLGVSAFDQGNYTDAITALVRVRTIFPSYEEWVVKSYMKMGECYLKLKDKKKAKEMYRIVYTKHRGDPFGDAARKKLRAIK